MKTQPKPKPRAASMQRAPRNPRPYRVRYAKRITDGGEEFRGQCVFYHRRLPSVLMVKEGCEHTHFEMELLIHEYLHHLFINAGEDWVDKTARRITKMLWRRGYRKCRP